jgi:exo-beta-1,3-glucanase (GH17 family)
MSGRCVQFGLLAIMLLSLTACASADKMSKSAGVEKRPLVTSLEGRWIGNGISYSAYRDGEGPDMDGTTSKPHILEDLRLLAQHWNLIRLYGADDQHQAVLEVIREHKLPIRVMQGAWLSAHQSADENRQQIERVIQLANEFDDIIVAVNVGNEIFVDWSWHRIEDMDAVIADLREVRSSIKQPVTVNDDYNFWNKPQAARIAAEVDFIGLHAYAFWNNQRLKDALQWTQAIYDDIQGRFPDHLIAYTETGWPTSRVYDDSYEGGLIGKAGEAEQRIFFDQYNAWINDNKIVSLYFSAFDEKWKGGFDGDKPMDKAEKHWGVFRSDRTPKQALD